MGNPYNILIINKLYNSIIAQNIFAGKYAAGAIPVAGDVSAYAVPPAPTISGDLAQ
jgi:hypothetical protein